MSATDFHLRDKLPISLLLDVGADADGVTGIIKTEELLLACLGVSLPSDEREIVPDSEGRGRRDGEHSLASPISILLVATI